MNHEDIEHDLVGAYVLDALTPQERMGFEAHLRECAACRAEAAVLQQTADVLPLALEPSEPSPHVLGRILDAIAEERPPLVPIKGGRQTPRQRYPWRTWEVVVGLAAALLIVALGAWNIYLQGQINHDKAALAYQQEVAAAIAGGAAVSQLPGTTSAPRASAALVQPHGSKPAYLIVQGLPPTPSRKVYEVWLIRTAPRPAGTFTYQGDNPQIVHIPVAATGYTLAAVTIEPGRQTAPTGPKVLLGKIRSS